MRLGEFIKRYREENNMSMRDFSRRSGISLAYVSLLEKDMHPKTGKPITPSIICVKQVADAIGMDFNRLFSELDCDIRLEQPKINPVVPSVSIPVLSKLEIGVIPNYSIDVRGYIEIPEKLARTSSFIGFKIPDDSMEPRICKGDIVILEQTSNISSGDFVVAIIDDKTVCRKLYFHGDDVLLVPLNHKYEPLIFSCDYNKNPDFRVSGKVVELRAKF